MATDDQIEATSSCKKRVGLFFYAWANLAVVVISMFVLYRLFAPQTFDRLDFAAAIDTTAAPLNNESWPIKYRTSVTRYFCSRPSPRIGISYEQAIAAWHLPSDATLSPSMFEMARCQLAAAVDNHDCFEPSQCSCMDAAGPFLATVLAVCFVFNVALRALGTVSFENEATFVSEAWTCILHLLGANTLILSAVAPGFRMFTDNMFTIDRETDHQAHYYYLSSQLVQVYALLTCGLINSIQMTVLFVLLQLRKPTPSKDDAKSEKSSGGEGKDSKLFTV